MLINILSQKDLDLILINKGSKNMIGLTSGGFDLFHSMHLAYLQKCRRMCDTLIVGVDSDEQMRFNKGPNRPIVPEHHRVMLVNALECVDITFIMDGLEDWKRACLAFRPHRIFRNNDFKPENVVNPDPRMTKVIIVPDVFQPDSTTKIIEEITKRKKP